MDPDRWQKVNALFHSALEQHEPDKDAFLRRECGEDHELFDMVQRILNAHFRADGFIETPAASEVITLLSASTESKSFAGQQFGVYRLIEEIGQGGMGVVFLAERTDDQFEQRVAIKIIKRGMDTDEVLKRFRNERQILASLEHSNVARLLDGGTTDNGLPYFVMEYIEGIPITKYASKHKLSIKSRLELFINVCSAVAYAHQRLVIHRDIKSSNIIVTNDGIPKLLDFGIAKLMTPDSGFDKATATTPGFHLMTPDYASPEQFKGESVTTSTDIYSLGVVLFELLTGQRPFEKYFKEFGKMTKAVVETDPPKPSEIKFVKQKKASNPKDKNGTQDRAGGNIVTKENIDENETDEVRFSPPPPDMVNPRFLRGDLDNIILKALRKEPENRYQTVDQFAEDVRRHLSGLPVSARPLSVKYRLSKFVGRNKLPVTLGAIIFLTLIAGIAATSWQSIRANRQKDLAEKRFKEVRKLANAVLFDYHDSIKDLPGSTPIRARIVNDALVYLDSLASDAGDDISLQRELASAYERVGDVQGGTMFANLGDTNGAIKSYQKSLQIREHLRRLDPGDFTSRKDVALSVLKLGTLLWETGDTDSALDQNKRALELLGELTIEKPGDSDLRYQLARTYGYLGNIVHDRGEFGKAMENFENELKTYRSLSQNELQTESIQRGISLAYEHIGIVFISKGDFSRALVNNTMALNIRKKLVEKFPINADYQRTLAVSYYNQGEILGNLMRYQEAIESYRKDLDIVEALAKKDPSNEQYRGDIAYGYIRFGDMETKLKKTDRALENYRRSESIRMQDVESDPSNLWKKSSLIEAKAKICKLLSVTDRVKATEMKCSETLSMMKETVVEPSNVTIRTFFAETYTNIGDAYSGISNKREACGLYETSYKIYKDLQNNGLLARLEIEKSKLLLPHLEACEKDL